MNSHPNIERLMRQTRAYEYSDGFIEIALGILFLLVGMFIYAFRDAPSETGIIGAVVLAIVIAASNWVIWRIRQRFTWKRTGYVALNHAISVPFRVARVAIALAIGVALNILLRIATGVAIWNPLVLAVCFLVFFVSEWQRVGQTRWLVLAFSAVLVALAIAVLPFTRETAFLAMTTYIGLGMLVCGIYALIRYFRTEPVEASQ
ncbi:MAG: hypothetical protein KGJ80_07915 [Chloroflexota bacterium]|nr:hypothetical protein [Chloroflexota bacterium]